MSSPHSPTPSPEHGGSVPKRGLAPAQTLGITRMRNGDCCVLCVHTPDTAAACALPPSQPTYVRRSHHTRDRLVHRLYSAWTHCVPSVGRSWWWGGTWGTLLRFLPWVDAAAIRFLRAHGVAFVGASSSSGGNGDGGGYGRSSSSTSTSTGLLTAGERTAAPITLDSDVRHLRAEPMIVVV